MNSKFDQLDIQEWRLQLPQYFRIHPLWSHTPTLSAVNDPEPAVLQNKLAGHETQADDDV
jgi:hypothetical protein